MQEVDDTTATQCMLVTTLIATIVFTGAFTIPGGSTRTKVYLFSAKNHPSLFMLSSDAVSLIASSTSVLIFLSILTSNYAEQDFMVWLPYQTSVWSCNTLLSIVTMMVAFSASFFYYFTTKSWNGFQSLSLVWLAFPVIIFVAVQFSLFKNVFYSAYRF
ncbi:putative PGG domain-containing protein [Helianthus annuus]|uniref:PGG domain-containing protein n=1 Tax=Helianthus annuus TaxID=4232 RepID=A0A9K3J034_HELAN|nr:putative PGG domain-containing protein [Helianthus annuus]